MLRSDFADLNNLSHCEFVRSYLKDEELDLFFIGDNEENYQPDNHDDEESCDCCEGLNGHLFRLHFYGVKDYHMDGEECDNYKTKEVKLNDRSLVLIYDGENFFEDGHLVTIAFSFERYDVIDGGCIQGPDA